MINLAGMKKLVQTMDSLGKMVKFSCDVGKAGDF